MTELLNKMLAIFNGDGKDEVQKAEEFNQAFKESRKQPTEALANARAIALKRLNTLTDILSEDDLNELCNMIETEFKQGGI